MPLNDKGDYVGPCQMDCPNRCEVPAGKTLHPLPRPRHAWTDVIVCPNRDDGCELAFLVVPEAAAEAALKSVKP